MTAAFFTLEIDGQPIPAEAMGSLRVVYEDLEARDDRRLADGTHNRRVAWTGKLRAVVSGEGFAPAGLDALSTTATYSVALPEQRDITSASNVITLPTARRSGGLYAPHGFALLDGRLVATPVSLVGDTATLTTVTGATHYRVDYWPQISAHISVTQRELDAAGRRHRWQLTAEEV